MFLRKLELRNFPHSKYSVSEAEGNPWFMKVALSQLTQRTARADLSPRWALMPGGGGRGPWSWTAWARIPALPRAGCVTLGKLLNLSVPECPHL